MSRPWFEAELPSGLVVSPGPESEEDLLDAAFELAHFLHHDREIARTICLEAMQRLEIAAVAQIKRLYYRPLRQNRFRASWGDRHLLQRLVYFHSEKWERLFESREPESLTEEDLLLRFWKHLCQITMKRNSFYASIALGRIVHAYSTADTMEIYHAIAPEDCERKQSDYLRSRKAQLLDEVRSRFGDLLSIIRGPHKEDRIETREPDPATAAWARESLRVLTPWAVPCWGRPESRAGAGRRPNRFASERDESSGEARRFHALFDPPCFARVARTARLADPSERLVVPRFRVGGSHPSSEDRGHGERRAHLLPEERAEIQRRLAEEARRRKEFPTRLLRILVDGRERARLDPRAARAARLSLEETAEMIEVRMCAPAGEIPLAVHALTDVPEREVAGSRSFSIELEAGQLLSFRVEPARGDSREVEVGYRETNPLRSALLAARRTLWQIGEAGKIAASWAAQPAALLTLLGVFGLWLSLRHTPAAGLPPTAAVAAAPISKPTDPIAVPAVGSGVSTRAPASIAEPAATAKVAPPRPRTRPLPLPLSPPEVSIAGDRQPEASAAAPTASRFSLVRTRLLPARLPAAPPAADHAVQVVVESPLEAVRRSFVEGLEEDLAPLHAQGEPPSRAMPIFARASVLERKEAAIRDLRSAAYQAAVSVSRSGSSIAPPLLSSKLDAPSPRISVIRPVGPPGLANSNCRQPEPSCGVARIAPAGAGVSQR